MRIAVFLCSACCLFAAAGPEAMASGHAEKPAVALMFHPGGFIFNDNPKMPEAVKAARDEGFRPISVQYTLWNLPRAVKDAVRAAKEQRSRGRTVFAYGDSAGGTLACLLAQRGLAQGAAVQAPVSNIPKFLKLLPPGAADLMQVTDVEAQLRFSPSKHSTRSPILAFAAVDDDLSAATTSWARRDPLVKARSIPGTHLDSSFYGPTLERAIGWLASRRDLERRRSTSRLG